MQHPDSQSTPRNKLKPLKTKDEFSSLHKKRKPLKEPLPNPGTPQPHVLRKPQIQGSNRVFSFDKHAGEPNSHSSFRQDGKNPKSKKDISDFRCILVDSTLETTLRVSYKRIRLGDKVASVTRFNYSICDNRLFYRYVVAGSSSSSRLQFDLYSEDNPPFKHACITRGIEVVNVGPNIPPVSKRIESSKPRPQGSDKHSTPIPIRLLVSQGANIIEKGGKPMEAIINERGIYFTTPPYKHFKWTEASYELQSKSAFPESSPYLLHLASEKTTATIDVLNQDKLDLIIENFKKRAQLPTTHDVKPPNSRPLDSSPFRESEDNHKKPQKIDFGAIEPAQFYSPQGKTAHPSKRPNSASSPKSFRNDGMSSSPIRAVESVRKLGSPAGASSCPKETPSLSDLSIRWPKKEEQSSEKMPSAEPSPEPETAPSETSQRPPTDPNDDMTPETPVEEVASKPSGRQMRRSRLKANLEDSDYEELVEPTSEDFSLLQSEGYKALLYRFWDGKSMNVEIEDIARLNPQIYVNDTIIWFFLKLFMEKLVKKDPELSRKILMLDTFFYYSMRAEKTPPSWVSKLPLASKHVIFMPIHERAHWSISVIIGLDKALQPEADPAYRPTIVILDSLQPTHVYSIVRKVVRVLASSLAVQGYRALDQSRYRAMRANVPKQTNLTDCGVFLLHYVEQILENPEQFLTQISNSPGSTLNMDSDFWRPDELYTKRGSFKNQLKEMGQVYAKPNSRETSSGGCTEQDAEKPQQSDQRDTSEIESRGRDSTPPSENGSNYSYDAGEDDDDDAIEVIGMETVKRARRQPYSRARPFGSSNKKRKSVSTGTHSQESTRVVDLRDQSSL